MKEKQRKAVVILFHAGHTMKELEQIFGVERTTIWRAIKKEKADKGIEINMKERKIKKTILSLPIMELVGKKTSKEIAAEYDIPVHAINLVRKEMKLHKEARMTKDEVIAALQDRARTGKALTSYHMLREDRVLYEWYMKYFGGIQEALEAAGIKYQMMGKYRV